MRACCVVALAATVLACHRLSPAEEKVVGTWEWTTIDAVGRMTVHPNHRFDLWFIDSKEDEDHPDPQYVTHGRWTVDGTEFTSTFDPGQLGGQLSAEQHRIPVSDFGSSMKKVH
jgi:hypothetical protein